MKNINIVLLFATIMLFSFCKKPGPIIISNSVDIRLVNQQSQNLLTPPTTLNESNIDVFYLSNGNATLFYKSSADFPKGFKIFNPDGQESLKLFSNDADEDFPVTIIKFGTYKADTLKCQVSRKNNSRIMNKLWLNGVLKFDAENRIGSESITIVK
ncbi:MAG: hypothetical protein EOO91_12010 [Pedobacter sp.]|nr:MAG: hypothetical protein EOO91_12010 [Pedobacter sp.]